MSQQKKVLALIKEDSFITTTEMARQLSVNRQTTWGGLDVLKNKGVIEHKGGKQYGYWEVYEQFLHCHRTIYQMGM